MGRFFLQPSLMPRLLSWLCLVALASVSACRGVGRSLQDALTPSAAGVSSSPLNPQFEYLQIGFEGRHSVMALGGRHTDVQAGHSSVIERWYNAQGEMLVLRDGRIDKAIGMAHEWRHQESTPPTWSALRALRTPVSWRRQVDRMPGYRYGQFDDIVTSSIPAPSRVVQGVPAHAHWFADEVHSTTREGRAWRYTQRFAVLNDRVVYSEQCLAPAVCFELRPLGTESP